LTNLLNFCRSILATALLMQASPSDRKLRLHTPNPTCVSRQTRNVSSFSLGLFTFAF
jgi:hypothetical protein